VTNLKECRENVEKCIDWANQALAVGAQNTYFDMAKAWLNLANIERAQAREHDKLVPFSHRDVDSLADNRPSRR
jgi:hypothetical protein